MNPRAVLIAGPHGSGKSRLVNSLQKKGVDLGHFIERTEDAYKLPSQSWRMRYSRLLKKRDVTWETLLTDVKDIDFLVSARKQGFHTTLYYMGLDGPTTSVDRYQGSEDIIPKSIAGRYYCSAAFLPLAISLVDHGYIFDNSKKGPSLTPLLRIKSGVIELLTQEQPQWVLSTFAAFI